MQLLRANNVPNELIVFAGEGQDLLAHSRWLRSFHATDTFFPRAMLRGWAIGQDFHQEPR